MNTVELGLVGCGQKKGGTKGISSLTSTEKPLTFLIAERSECVGLPKQKPPMGSPAIPVIPLDADATLALQQEPLPKATPPLGEEGTNPAAEKVIAQLLT